MIQPHDPFTLTPTFHLVATIIPTTSLKEDSVRPESTPLVPAVRLKDRLTKGGERVGMANSFIVVLWQRNGC